MSETNKKPVILAVLAHPDDESFGMGGTLALYARRGCDVHLVCATRGEVGGVDDLQGFDSVAELREGELRCAAGLLQLQGVHFLGYRDSGMPGSPDNRHPDAQVSHPVDEVAGKVVKFMRELKPDVVLTFDPIGGYRHPDHIHIHQATVLAFENANNPAFHPESGSPVQLGGLYFHTFPRWFLRVVTRILPLFGKDPRKFGRNGDIDLRAIADVNFPTHVRVNISAVDEIKAAASACHSSQGGMQMRRGVMGWFSRLFGRYEEFMQAYPLPGQKWKIRTDLL